jgi:hypothetical protein
MPREDVGWIFVVERVKAALEQAGFVDISFTSLDAVQRIPRERAKGADLAPASRAGPRNLNSEDR